MVFQLFTTKERIVRTGKTFCPNCRSPSLDAADVFAVARRRGAARLNQGMVAYSMPFNLPVRGGGAHLVYGDSGMDAMKAVAMALNMPATAVPVS